MRTIICLALAFIGFLQVVYGQYFRHYTVEDGLSNNIVFSSLQDRRGFMWFGTRDGLNRFNGYSFKVFRHDPADTTSLGSNFINCLYQDKQDRLWVGTGNGLYQYRPDQEDFRLIQDTRQADVMDVLMDTVGNIWYIANLRLYCYHPDRGVIRSFDDFSATSMALYRKQIWVATNNGRLICVSTKGIDTSFSVLQNQGSASLWIEKIHPLSSGELLIGTAHYGAWIFQPITGKATPLMSGWRHLYVRDFLELAPNQYWIATENGIFRYDRTSGSVARISKQFGNPYALSDNAIYTLCKDKEGGVWAGSYFGGVNYYAGKNELFQKFYPQHDRPSVSGNAVREICLDDDQQLWIGTEDAGLNKMDLRTGAMMRVAAGGGSGSLSSTNIHALLPVGNQLWVGTFEQGLDILDRRTNRVIKHYSASDLPGALRSNFIITMLRTRDGRVFVGTGWGLFQYQEKTDSFLPVAEVAQHDFIYSLFEDHQGTIWAGTLRNGVYYFNPHLGTSGQYQADPDKPNGLPSNAINGIFEDADHHLWLATEGGGFCKRISNGNFKSYTVKDGLPSDITFRILQDSRKQLWISSSKGLIEFDPTTETFRTYTQADGLITDQFNYNSGICLPDGTLYFGSVKGMIRFNPTHFHRNNIVPAVYITGFQLGNKELSIAANSPLKQAISFTDYIRLDYNQATFSLDFAALSYVSPDMNEYAYRMEGLEDEWTYLRTNRKVYFTNLSPGTYQFQVKGANSNGVWNKDPVRLTIQIDPPFYASIWAYVFYICCLLGLIYYLIYNYLQRTHRIHESRINQLEQEKAREIYQAKIDFFTNITHEIRTPLTLIKAPLDKLLAQQPDAETTTSLQLMQKNTSYLMDLINQLLDFRRDASPEEGLYFSRTDLVHLLEETCLRYQPLITQRALTFELSLPSKPLFAFVDQRSFQKILSNLIDNAIKYADKYVRVLLEIQDSTHQVLLLVANDGPHIPATDRQKIFEPFFRLRHNGQKIGTGLGLSLVKSLVHLHKGTLHYTVNAHQLNEFSLQVPVHQDHEFDMQVASDRSPVQIPLVTTQESKYAVLLVEDHPDILALLSVDFAKQMRVWTAANGEDAMHVLAEHEISLIISDVMMPVMDGFELCRQVKNNLLYAHIPVILLTAKTALPAKIEGLEYGADVYIEKPFSVDYVLAQANSLLANRERMKNYVASSPLVGIKTMAANKTDEGFLEKLNQVILDNLGNPELDVRFLASALHMSQPTLFRKIKGVSDLKPNELITMVRLKKAAELLASHDLKMYEVCEQIGYNSQSYFSRSFQKQFGITPSEYIQKIRQKGYL